MIFERKPVSTKQLHFLAWVKSKRDAQNWQELKERRFRSKHSSSGLSKTRTKSYPCVTSTAPLFILLPPTPRYTRGACTWLKELLGAGTSFPLNTITR